MKTVTLTMTRKRALELGLLVCACGHPENNHFGTGRWAGKDTFGGRHCARCTECKGYRERGINGTKLSNSES